MKREENGLSHTPGRYLLLLGFTKNHTIKLLEIRKKYKKGDYR